MNLGAPTTPRPAAGLALLRDRGKGLDTKLEVLMLQRTERAQFMPGAWVFPGGSVDIADGVGDEGFRTCALRELTEEAGIELDLDAELVEFSRFVTPEEITTRFDARFFLAIAPPDASAEPDGVEVIESAWLSPRAALGAQERDEQVIGFPTIYQLRWLSTFSSSSEAISYYRSSQPGAPRGISDAESR